MTVAGSSTAGSSVVAVAVTVLNEVADIERLVNSLLAQTLAAEVTVVDGGSTDGTWEWLESKAAGTERLVAIRDESCSLRNSAGPISRGRNRAVAASSAEVLACADAGCVYGPEWLRRLTAPIVDGEAEYALGGSCLEAEGATVWDLAAAPFFGIKLDPEAPNKSCTARSMAFRRDLWKRVGGFSETVFFGEDTLFDREARRLTRPVFAEGAKALYRPQYTLRSAMRQLADYAINDGILGVRPARLFRNAARCVVEVLALAALRWMVWPVLAVFALETYFAFRLDGRALLRWLGDVSGNEFGSESGNGGGRLALVGARLWFSLLVPWIVAVNQIRGRRTKRPRPNRQNR